jgi:signal transduction histidine kinase
VETQKSSAQDMSQAAAGPRPPLVAFFGVLSRLAFFGDWTHAVVLTGVLDTFGFFLTCGVHLAARRWLVWPVSAVKVVPLAVLLAFAGGLLQLTVSHAIWAHVLIGAEGRLTIDRPLIPLIYYTAIFLGWSLAYLWLTTDHAARAAREHGSEAQATAVRAELEQLRTQLDPRFLFNALNAVTAEVHDRPDIALEMTHRIASYLRYLLDRQDLPVCWLAEEIEAASSYLRIQELRYDRLIEYTVTMEAQAGRFQVPHLILHELVENAVKHGLNRSSLSRLHIEVRAMLDCDRLVVTVTNQGQLLPGSDRKGLGLANIRRRLQLHFPERHALTLAQEGELVVARLTMQAPISFA